MNPELAYRRPVALITGAGGGMGAACARVLAHSHRLILTDLREAPLAEVVRTLEADGADVPGTIACDISAPETLARITGLIDGNGGLDALVHAAGVSPQMAPWDRLLTINLRATLDLLDAVEPRLRPGAAGVLIASMAGHVRPPSPEVGEALQKPRDNLLQLLEPLVRAMAASDDALLLSVAAYGVSKDAVIQLCQQRAAAWGARWARIASISPGLIATPMGLMEAATNPSAGGLAEQAPAGRWGTPLDIAHAARFLLSDAASFISGCDLQVDGGLVAKLKN